ncbi:serine hydrolase [Dokdonia pacifica]|uniref:CubicO group peptidase, beta-lactamase class C family n=1 Tax=Dokdonia pacifica TaxID=1627892 RepID=A0A238ZID4_9FLAO|nr:serine hydrolase [Dokdonia pacifica]GGG06330.1 serine hydrolase [Dokdonia pacifica]SNR82464.1 CubicO group peptidase, beta-lactamase class C family [Dokdonia pacifica]
MNTKLIYSFFLGLLSASSFGQETFTYTTPTQYSDGWKTSDLHSQSIDTTLLYKGFTQLATVDHKMHSALIIKNDHIVFEHYYQDYAYNKQQDLRSVNKSIKSILMGIAIDKGFIDSEDDLISKYLKKPVPEKNLDPRKEKITIKHLLTMSTGLECNDWDKKSKGQEDRVYKKKDWLQYTLDLPMVREPGETSLYCSMCTLLAAEIIQQASGMPLEEFTQKYLFDPLGITNIKRGHTTTNKEIINTAKRIYMTPRDMAKIGKLILQKGNWNGQQIVSEAWIDKATAVHTKITGINYGYLWWQFPFNIQGQRVSATLATGNGGQYIMVFPEQDMIIVFTGGAYNSQEDKLPFKIVQDLILPSLR